MKQSDNRFCIRPRSIAATTEARTKRAASPPCSCTTGNNNSTNQGKKNLKSQPTNHEINQIAVNHVHTILVRSGAKVKRTRKITRTIFTIPQPSGREITVSVRAKRTPIWWMIPRGKSTDFVVFLDYEDKWQNPYCNPDLWILSDEEVQKVMVKSRKVNSVAYKNIALAQYRDAWHRLVGDEPQGDWCGTGALIEREGKNQTQ